MKQTTLRSLLTVAVALVCSLAAWAAPEIHVVEEVYDFGVAVEGEIVSFTFLLENQGDEVLIIESVGSSCGCTTTDLSEPQIEPGKTVRLGGGFNTSGYGGATASKNVYISCNDPVRPELTLKVTGRVVREAAYLVDAAELAGSLMLLIDIRDAAAYAAGHLPGAVNLAVSTADVWFDLLPKDTRIVLYDQDGETAGELAELMLPMGFLRVEVLTGGLDEWTRRYADRMLITLPLVLAPRESD